MAPTAATASTAARAKSAPIDKNTYYDWPRTWEMIRAMQPDAVVFSDVGPDVRWVGQRTRHRRRPVLGHVRSGGRRRRTGVAGQRAHTRIHQRPAPRLEMAARRMRRVHPSRLVLARGGKRAREEAGATHFLYYQSVGRGATLLLNVPPNRDGLLSPEDVASLQGFGAYLKATFTQNLAARARTDATHVRGNDKQFGPAHLLDGRPDTFWATDDNVTSADVTFDLGHPVKFSVIRLKEAIRYGQRIDAFTVERWQSDSWEPVASSTSIGPRRLIRLDAPIIATRLRLRITQASASPALSEFAVFSEAAPG